MQRIVITGASRGIGRATAVRLASEEREIILIGRDIAAMEETGRLVKARGGAVAILTGRLDTDQGLREAAARLSAERVDALVNNAGVSHVAPIRELSLERWQEALAVNVTAPFVLAQSLLPNMPPGASIVNVLSVANKTAFPNWGAYTMSKAALEGFSRVLREEVRPRGIRVIDVYLAATATELWDSVPGEWDRTGMLRAEEAAEAIAYAIERPGGVMVESISVGGIGGNL